MAFGTDNFQFDLIDNFEGYVSAKDKTNVSPNVLVGGSINCYKKINGNIAVRPGLKRYGQTNSDVAGIISADEWYTSTGREYPFRVVEPTAAGNDGKLQVLSTLADGSTPVWYDLQTALTAAQCRYVFDAWWSSTELKDRWIWCRGDSNLYWWSGGFTLAAAQAGGGATLTKSDTTTTWAQDGFNTTGDKTFTIYGSATVYTYTGGESTTTLTGITPALPAISAGDIIVQSVITETNIPAAGFNADFLKTIGNQLYVGSYTSRLVYISSSSDFTNYTVPSPRVAGDPELLTLDNNGKGISVRQGTAHITAGLADWYVINFVDISVGTDLTQQTVVEKQETAALSAALAHEFIDTVGDDIVYLSQDQQLRNYGTFRNINTAKFPSLSQQIHTELEAETFVVGKVVGQVKAIGDFIYVTSPSSGRTYMQQTRESLDVAGNIIAERLWHPPQEWNISRIALINGVEYGHSTANPQLYQLWNTGQFHDDSPSDDPVPYDVRMCMAYRQHNRRQGLLGFDKVYVEGYILNNSGLNLKVYSDYLDPNPQNKVIAANGDMPVLFPPVNPETIGGSMIGEIPIGGGTVEENIMPKFRAIVDVQLKNCFEYQLELYSEVADSSWEILALGTNTEVAAQQATNIRI
jgi:hypothetical protein